MPVYDYWLPRLGRRMAVLAALKINFFLTFKYV